jgi:hypothetical protein
MVSCSTLSSCTLTRTCSHTPGRGRTAMATYGGSTIASCRAGIPGTASQHGNLHGSRRAGGGTHLRGAEDVEEGALGEGVDAGGLDLVERVEDVVWLQDALPLVHVPAAEEDERPEKKIRGRRDETGTTDGGITIN